jgi:hypothetical protein
MNGQEIVYHLMDLESMIVREENCTSLKRGIFADSSTTQLSTHISGRAFFWAGIHAIKSLCARIAEMGCDKNAKVIIKARPNVIRNETSAKAP